jgi:hypothetical protein
VGGLSGGAVQTLYLGGMATVDEIDEIKVRYRWNKIDQDRARWEQAFSYDNRTWEMNWTADFERADPGRTCVNNRPRR